MAQVRPSASASTAFTATLRTEITQIVVCNVTSTATAFDIYHDDDGTTYTQATALFYGAAIAGNTTVSIMSEALGSGIMMARGASLGVKPSTDLALTFTVYGVTEEIATR